MRMMEYSPMRCPVSRISPGDTSLRKSGRCMTRPSATGMHAAHSILPVRPAATSIAHLRRSRRPLLRRAQLQFLDLDGFALGVVDRHQLQRTEPVHFLLADVPEDAGVLPGLVVKSM